MNSSQATQTYTLTAEPRHLQLLFYVGRDYPAAQLRRLIVKNLQRWGGRYNPIVPLDGGELETGWDQVLAHQDPDYVYYLAGTDPEIIRQLCDRFGHNPIEMIELDDRLLDVHGVHFANMMLLPAGLTLPRVYNLGGIDTPLADFYTLNLFVEDTLPVNRGAWTQENDWLFQHHRLLLINKGNFNQACQVWADSQLISVTRMAELNSKSAKLRLANPVFHGFELVVHADNAGFDELIYHWNKALYDIYSWHPLTIVLSRSELELLLVDPHFKSVLFKYSGQHLKISLVSFSLSDEEQDELVARLKTYNPHNSFERKAVMHFPFAVRDRQGLNQQALYERAQQQVIFRQQPFISLPPLSFNLEFKPFSQSYAIRLRIAEVRGPFNRSLRFPVKAMAEMITSQPARIDRSRQVLMDVNEPLHKEGHYSLRIPEFYDVASQVIGAPKITGSRDVRNIYRGIAYSDGSRRLGQFIKLFGDNYLHIQAFLHDQFWNGLFLDLSDNSRTEGDTVTFATLYDRCYAKMVEESVKFTEKKESRFNAENLRLGLKRQVQELTDRKILMPGYIIKCRYCGSRIWYGIQETGDIVSCKGCSNPNHFPVESPLAYKLNHLVRNNYGMKDDKGIFRPDGNLTAIRTLLYLWNKAVNSFEYIPQIDIYDCNDAHKPMTDLDIIAMSGGEFYIGECKHTSTLFAEEKNKSLLNLIAIAKTARPDKIILSCTVDPGGKLQKAAQFIRHHIRDWMQAPEVVTFHAVPPSSFESRDSKYFLH